MKINRILIGATSLTLIGVTLFTVTSVNKHSDNFQYVKTTGDSIASPRHITAQTNNTERPINSNMPKPSNQMSTPVSKTKTDPTTSVSPTQTNTTSSDNTPTPNPSPATSSNQTQPTASNTNDSQVSQDSGTSPCQYQYTGEPGSPYPMGNCNCQYANGQVMMCPPPKNIQLSP